MPEVVRQRPDVDAIGQQPAHVRVAQRVEAMLARRVVVFLSNSRLEGINARIRLIQCRGFGIRDVDSLTSMIYLCLGGIVITLPNR